jgi:ubiquinol oxidase
MRSFIISFFAYATITVESFQPSRVSPSRGERRSPLGLQESSSFSEEDKEEKSAPFFAAAESSSTTTTTTTMPFPSSTSNGAVTPDIAINNNDSSDSVSALQVQVPVPPAKTMDEGIYGFNKAVIDTVYDIICFLYPVKGTERDYARFYVLETVARVPYFAYLSVMHLRETFGERYPKMSDRMRTHYAEADNELHHLLIMESLGGNSNIVDRTLAQTMAFGYYWYVIVIYTFNESAAYHLSELIEDHAYNTYSKFTEEYEERLKLEPVPDVARKYYELDNPFLFDLFCTVKNKSDTDSSSSIDGSNNYSSRRPQLTSLYDVFINIRDDEKEHWKTLCNLVQYDDMNAVDATEVQSTTPSAPPATAVATATATD